MQNAETRRLFVAIPLPEPVKDEIEQAQAELRRASPEEGIRWTKRAQFHLTLKFLGDVEVDQLSNVKHCLGWMCEPFSAMTLKAEGIGFFPLASPRRVIWAGVKDPCTTLRQLQMMVEIAMQPFTRARAEGIFTGHVTLGRVNQITHPQAELLAKLALGMNQRCFGEWTADKVELIRSELGTSGARYTTLAVVPLAG